MVNSYQRVDIFGGGSFLRDGSFRSRSLGGFLGLSFGGGLENGVGLGVKYGFRDGSFGSLGAGFFCGSGLGLGRVFSSKGFGVLFGIF